MVTMPVIKAQKDLHSTMFMLRMPQAFGAAADDYSERGIDLNEELIRNKPATFFFRMNGDAMIGVGIFSGDILIVDRSIKATNGKIIVAFVEGDLVIRRFQQTINSISLVPGKPPSLSYEA